MYVRVCLCEGISINMGVCACISNYLYHSSFISSVRQILMWNLVNPKIDMFMHNNSCISLRVAVAHPDKWETSRKSFIILVSCMSE